MTNFLGVFSVLRFFLFILSLGFFLGADFSRVVIALPDPGDVPEEVLRTEIIVEGRSPLDNQPLSAQEYAELQQSLRESKYPPQLDEEVRHTVFLLQLLKMFRTFNPL